MTAIRHLAHSIVFSRSAVSRSSVVDTIGEKIREITSAGVLPSAPNSDSLLCEWEGELVRPWILTSTGLDHLQHGVCHVRTSHTFKLLLQQSDTKVSIECVCLIVNQKQISILHLSVSLF